MGMRIFIEVQTLVEGDYLNAKVTIPVDKKKYRKCKGGAKQLSLSWVKSESRVVENKAMDWIRKYKPELEAEFETYARWVQDNIIVKGENQ